MDLYEELLSLIDCFSKHNIDYALCGGIAVAFHGYPRFTKDIDLLIQTEDLERVLKVVAERGFIHESGKLPFGAGGPFEREIHRVSKVEGKDLLTLDFLLVSPALQDVWESREIFEWKRKQVQIVSTEGLSKMKRLSGRDQDLLDLKQLGLLETEGDEKDS